MSTSNLLTARGYELDDSPSAFGELRRSDDLLDDTFVLQQRLKQDGYLYIPGFFQRKDVMSVRIEMVRRLALAGKLDPRYDPMDAVACQEDQIPEHLRKVEVQKIKNIPLQNLVFSDHILSFYERLLGGAVLHYDHIWVRNVAPGNAIAPHCDVVYMGRGTHEVCTAWIPYGDISLDMGGLMLLENSHHQAQRLKPYLDRDVDVYCINRTNRNRFKGHLSNNPVSLREKLGGRWLTAQFCAGDLLTFQMKLVHAGIDNKSRCYRLSSDTRYQRADQTVDERWIGPNTEEWGARNRRGLIC